MRKLQDDDIDIDIMITTYNTTVTGTASEILGKDCLRKKPWVTRDVFYLCDEWRDFEEEAVWKKSKRKNTEKLKRGFGRDLKKAKEDWIDTKGQGCGRHIPSNNR